MHTSVALRSYAMLNSSCHCQHMTSMERKISGRSGFASLEDTNMALFTDTTTSGRGCFTSYQATPGGKASRQALVSSPAPSNTTYTSFCIAWVAASHAVPNLVLAN